ncbi:hypothetical protein KUCAC02_003729 [Chaenocephalus aceratus]|uniref:Uncharacterized protein n=1 Tax=Chaenocephalus aceratus TaxID=36190 RepID=A0ACB9WLH6_CHAAC|nr:hypothetical protein KUCAC02_003729 [Chaenocephalus aceratus]
MAAYRLVDFIKREEKEYSRFTLRVSFSPLPHPAAVTNILYESRMEQAASPLFQTPAFNIKIYPTPTTLASRKTLSPRLLRLPPFPFPLPLFYFPIPFPSLPSLSLFLPIPLLLYCGCLGGCFSSVSCS